MYVEITNLTTIACLLPIRLTYRKNKDMNYNRTVLDVGCETRHKEYYLDSTPV